MTGIPVSPAVTTRIVPAVVFDIRRPQRMIERSWLVTKRHPMIVFSGSCTRV